MSESSQEWIAQHPSMRISRQKSMRKRWGCTHQVRKLRTHVPQLPVCVRPVKRALAVAKAPTYLEQTLKQRLKPPRKMANICAWVNIPIPFPRLVPDSLFGTCLENVLNTKIPTAKQAGEAKPNRAEISPYSDDFRFVEKGRPGLPKDLRTPDQIHRSQPGRLPHFSRGDRPKPEPFAYPSQANLEMLARQAGGFRKISHFANQQIMTNWKRSFFAVGSSHYSHPDFPGDALTAQATLTLLTRWLGRLRERLREVPGYSNISQTISTSAEERDDMTDKSKKALRWLTRAFTEEPTGPIAPLALLLRLIGETESQRGTSSEERSPSVQSAKSSPDDSNQLLRSQAERTSYGVPDWDAPFSSTPRADAPSPTNPSPTGAKQGFYPQSGSLHLPAAGQPNFRPPLAPPLAFEHSPTLLPPQQVFDAPTPFAAATARQAAKFDETNLVEEDLDVLASKIKRILDDEARRYGIQVA